MNYNDYDYENAEPKKEANPFEGLSQAEIDAITAQINKTQNMIAQAQKQREIDKASHFVNRKCQQFAEQHGVQPSHWHVEQIKREGRAQGLECW